MKSPAVIQAVLPGSIAEEAGIVPGDTLVSINGDPVLDILAYRYLVSDEELEIELLKKDGSRDAFFVEKEPYEDLGVTFVNPLIGKARSCANKCIFCFIDQLPKGMREPVYFKDDDTTLSFFQGNYVTLTNLSDEDFSRLIRYHVSPINISVHSTDPALRVRMLKNPNAGNIMERMKTLRDHHITMNGQIVLCPGVNDGEALRRTLSDLVSLYPAMHSVSVVPVGLTKHRVGLEPLEPLSAAGARELIQIVSEFSDGCLKRFGTRMIYLSDEIYIKAGVEIPKAEVYEDFPQIENGVGLVASLREEFYDALNGYMPQSIKREISVATGKLAAPFILELADALISMEPGARVHVYAIENEFFGPEVTVSGLVTGGDLSRQLQGKPLGEKLLIPRSMLRAEGDLFLDDYTIERLENELGVTIETVENDGAALLDAFRGE